MPNRASDWFRQAERDLEQAVASSRDSLHEWACFAAQQAAEKAVKALHLAKGQEAWGHVVARLLTQLPVAVPPDLIEKARYWTTITSRPATPTATLRVHLSSITAPCKAVERSIMPVRSLTSSVLKWPDRRCVEEALLVWVTREEGRHPDLLRLGYFGSYARGDWGVGSDLDLIALVREAGEPFERRALSWELNPLPVPSELLVYTEAEWRRLLDTGSRFAETVMREAVWVYP